MFRTICLVLILCSTVSAEPFAFLAAPRTTGKFATPSLSEQDGPYTYPKNAQLIVSDNGVERVLVDGGVYHVNRSEDGKSLLVTIVEKEGQNGIADVWRVDIATGEKKKLTDGVGWNIQGVETADGVCFLSNRDRWKSPKERYCAFTIYNTGFDGGPVKRIHHAAFGGIFGLNINTKGRLLFVSGEQQGLRGGRGNNWAVFSCNPDGSDIRPEVSAFGIFTAPESGRAVFPFDWPVELKNGALAWTQYYDTRKYGIVFWAPNVSTGSFTDPPTMFGHPLPRQNPRRLFGYERRGLVPLTPQSTVQDVEAKRNGLPVGQYSHTAALPDSKVAVTWTGNKGDALMDLGIYMIDPTKPITDYNQLVKIVDREDRHEWFFCSLAPLSELYGIVEYPATQRIKDAKLPVGSPYGVVGSSRLHAGEFTNFSLGEYPEVIYTTTADETEYLRITTFQPTTLKVPPPGVKLKQIENNPGQHKNNEGFITQLNEREGFYDTLIPVKKYRKPDGGIHYGPGAPEGSEVIRRADGEIDTSFEVELPADQPFAFALLNAKKEVLKGSKAMTWHQLRPGESNNRCQGCHNHWKPDQTTFDETFAATLEYDRKRLSKAQFVVLSRDLPLIKNEIDFTKIKPYSSAESTVDDDPKWTQEQAELIRAAIDTGSLDAGYYTDGSQIQPADKIGPYADTVNPTLNVVGASDSTVIGALDPQSGIKELVVLLNGVDITSQYTFDSAEDIWTGPGVTGTLKVTVKDNHNNSTVHVETVKPDNSAEIARIRGLLDAAIAEVARLQQLLDSLTQGE